MSATTATATAAWSADRLLDALQSRGWGDELAGHPNAGLRTTLNALVSLLPYESAEGRLTRAQVADAAGISPKWAGKCLARLEALGLITWRRGWLDHGQPRAGWIRLVKTRLAELVRGVRGYLDERRELRRQATRERLEKTLTQRTVRPWRLRSPLSSRWELGSTLPTLGSTSRARGAFQQPSQTLPFDTEDAMSTCSTCGKHEAACQLANAKVPLRGRHPFTVGSSAFQLVAAAHELHPEPQTKGAPRMGWRDRVASLADPMLDLDPQDGAQ